MKKLVVGALIPTIGFGLILLSLFGGGTAPVDPNDFDPVSQVLESPELLEGLEDFLVMSPQNWFAKEAGNLVIRLPLRHWWCFQALFLPEVFHPLENVDQFVEVLAALGFTEQSRNGAEVVLIRSLSWTPLAFPRSRTVATDPGVGADEGTGTDEGSGGTPIVPKPKRSLHPEQWVDFEALADAFPALVALAAVVAIVALGVSLVRRRARA